MIAVTIGVLLACHSAFSFPYPGPAPAPGPNAYPGPAPMPGPAPRPGPGPMPAPAPSADPYYGIGGFGLEGIGLGGYGGYGLEGIGLGGYGGYGLGGFGGYGGYGGFVEEVITPPVSPPVLNTVDVFDIATLGVIPAPPIEYVYPAVGYEAFGLGGYPGIVEEVGFGGYGGGYGFGGYPGLGGYGGGLFF